MPGARETVSGQLDRRAVQAAERTADALERIATALEWLAGIGPTPDLDNPSVDTPE